jgi:hypothetical protein
MKVILSEEEGFEARDSTLTSKETLEVLIGTRLRAGGALVVEKGKRVMRSDKVLFMYRHNPKV